MYETFIRIRNSIIGFFYRNILKKIFFKRDPEDVHDRMSKTGEWLGKSFFGRKMTSLLFDYHHPSLEQNILGIHFRNPLGLSAGFDKNAVLTDILPSVGFGFAELGSITGEPCAGNPKPRLWRLPKSQSLVVYYGLKNDGCEVISGRLGGKKFKIPYGISIAKTNSPDTCELEAGVKDYLKAFRHFVDIGDYITINISCPNAYGGEPFTDPKKLENLLVAVDKIPYLKPVFLKLAADLDHSQIDALLEVASRHRIHGFICTNLTKKRENPKILDDNVPEKGGLSGKVAEDLATEMIRYIYQKTKGKYIIIGCGGVFSASDAYQKIKAGASLIQMITGMIFQGPQVISEINQGLIELLRKDGFQNVGEAVGAEFRR